MVTQRNNIDARTLRDMLERGERVTVVDVRKGEDCAEWSIPGSVSFDAYDALHAGDEQAMEGLELPEGARVMTFCNRGTSGAVAAEQLLGGEGTRRTPWRAGWKPGEGPLTCPCIARAGPYRDH